MSIEEQRLPFEPAQTHEMERKIQALHARYVRVLDDAEYEKWPQLFSDDGRYSIVTLENHRRGLPLPIMSCEGRGMMLDRITGLRRINVYEPQSYSHQISALAITSIEDNGNLVCCISNYQVVRILVSGAMSIFSVGTYRDRIRISGSEALFEERTVVHASSQVDTLLVIPL
jgi:anthranilate 1,2-dioxygenase small subunit